MFNRGIQLLAMGVLLNILFPSALSDVALAEETPDVVTVMQAKVERVQSIRELEDSTFYVVNITEHESVLPAELTLGGSESEWQGGVRAYAGGKEVPTALLSGEGGTSLLVSVKLKPKETKRVTFAKGKCGLISDLRVEEDRDSGIVTVRNSRATWKIGPDGIQEFERDGKKYVLTEKGLSDGNLKVTVVRPHAR